MPVSLSFSEPSTFIVKASGDVIYEECIGALDDLVAHPRLRDEARILVDGRTVSNVPSTEELRALAQSLQRLSERHVHTMAIVTSSRFVYGVARMFAAFADIVGVSVLVFQQMELAERWLTDPQPREH